MPRKKLSEYRAKQLLYQALGQDYQGWEIDAERDWQSGLAELPEDQRYVIKVDQAEKGRFKKGLVKLDQAKSDLAAAVAELQGKGYRFLLIEPFRQHEQAEEHYLALARTRSGLDVAFSTLGGVDIEAHADQIKHVLYDENTGDQAGLPGAALQKLADAFEQNYFSFLEINPLLIHGDQLELLDAAVEVDSEAQFFEDGWLPTDIRTAKRQLEPEEVAVQELADTSQASFSLEVLNPNGRIWLLLSGGGASVVVADEVSNLGYGKDLGNYGEYSGNPNLEETRSYTEQIVKLLLKSAAKDKVLIIGGGVANFTDIRATFKGVIEALTAHEAELKSQGVKVYVRRGGPHQQEGLAAIKAYLENAGILGLVAGPEMVLTDIVSQAVGQGAGQ